MVRFNIRSILVGRNRSFSVGFVLLAVLLFVSVTVFAIELDTFTAPFSWLFTGYNAVSLVVVLLVIAAMNAYVNSGVVVSCLLVIAPLLGLAATDSGIGFFNDPTRPELAFVVLSSTLLYGVPVGLLGFLSGAGVRRIVG